MRANLRKSFLILIVGAVSICVLVLKKDPNIEMFKKRNIKYLNRAVSTVTDIVKANQTSQNVETKTQRETAEDITYDMTEASAGLVYSLSRIPPTSPSTLFMSRNHVHSTPRTTSPSRNKDELNKSYISCRKLIAGDRSEINRSYGKTFNKKRRTSTEGLVNATKDCEAYVSSRGYITQSVSREESDFPVAFTILMYRDPEQVERLLRSIYRPQNFYCIHVDKKTSEKVHEAMKGVADCFDNVFIAPKNIKVYWGTIATLRADMICMKALWEKSTKWKYYINLTGQEFPLKTNYELVKILQAYNGSNIIGGKVRKSHWSLWKKRPPHNLQPMKGSFHIIASRGYVDYVMTSPIAKDLLHWCEESVKVPDETYYSTLNYNPQLKIPGSYKQGNPGSSVSHVRYKVWYNKRRCAGKVVRGICVFGVGDLHVLTNRTEPFANKFQYQYQPLTYDCLEEWLNEKVEREYSGDLSFNNTFYKTLPFVVNKI